MEKHSEEPCGFGYSAVIAKRIGKRIARHGSVIVLAVTINFLLMHLMPGDPLIHLLGEEAYGHLSAQDPLQLDAIKARYGLDASLGRQYFSYLSAIAGGDLGISFQYHTPVIAVILYHLKRTLILLVPSWILSVFAGGLAGLLTGLSTKKNPAGRVFSTFSLILYSVPLYCLSFFLLFIFAFKGGWVPLAGIAEQETTGIGGLLRQMLLPAATLVLHAASYYCIIMRSATEQALREAFVFNSIARGFSRRYILFHHVLKNALPPFVTAAAMQAGALFGGSLLVEIIFSWQGIGTLIYGAVSSRDYPLLSGCFLIITICVIAANAAADGLCALIDPRIKDGARSL